MRIPKIDYGPLLRATNQGYQIKQNRLDYRLQKQQLALGWAELGLKAAGVLDGYIKRRDHAKSTAAKIDYMKKLHEFTQDRIARGDYEYVEERGEENEVIGRRPNWEKLYQEFRDQNEAKYIGKDSLFLTEGAKEDFRAFMEDAFRQESMRMTAIAREKLDAEFKTLADANLKEALKQDIADTAASPEGKPNLTLALVRSWQADGYLKADQADVLLAGAEKDIKKGRLDRDIFRLAQAGGFEEAVKVLNANKELYSQAEFNARQGDVRTMNDEYRHNLEQGFNRVFTSPMLKGEPVDAEKARAYIEGSGAPEDMKKTWNQTFDTFMRTRTHKWFNDKLGDAAVWDSLPALEALKKEVQRDREMRYANREDLRIEHLKEIETRMRFLSSEESAAARGAISAVQRKNALIAAKIVSEVKIKNVDPKTAMAFLTNLDLAETDFTQYTGAIFGIMSQNAKTAYDEIKNHVKFDSDKGELFYIEGGKKAKIPRDLNEYAVDALVRGMNDGSVKPGEEGKFVRKIFQPYLVGGLEFTDILTGQEALLPFAPIRQGQDLMEKADIADQWRLALYSGAFRGRIAFDQGKLYVAPDVEKSLKDLWASDEERFQKITGLTRTDYEPKTEAQFVPAPGVRVFVSGNTTYQWIPTADGNSYLVKTEAGKPILAWSPREKTWVKPEEINKAPTPTDKPPGNFMRLTPEEAQKAYLPTRQPRPIPEASTMDLSPAEAQRAYGVRGGR